MNDYMDTVGRIFDIQKFSVHDGPGVRTIVFLKGCIFRCRWCCNPESQNYEIEQMTTNGITKTIGQDITVRAVMREVLKDRVYYQRSGGGLTLSGGESLTQPDFAAALFRAAKESGITTALESTGCAPYEHIEKILPWLDVYLMDIKHMNGEKHKEYTGRSNELILENAVKIARDAKELIIRVPVVPGFNDTPEEIADIAQFSATLPNVKQIHLLPYHRLGQDKYQGLGRDYLMKDVVPPPNEHMQSLLEAASGFGLHVQIGG